MDENSNGYLNVREMVRGIGLTCSGPAEERLKLLFRLHMPPYLTDMDVRTIKEDNLQKEVVVAAEAMEFFQNLNNGKLLLLHFGFQVWFSTFIKFSL